MNYHMIARQIDVGTLRTWDRETVRGEGRGAAPGHTKSMPGLGDYANRRGLNEDKCIKDRGQV